MSFATQHASALAKVQDKGAAVTFTDTTQGSYDPETDTATASSSTVSGYAIQVPSGSPQRYAQLGLVESRAPMLLFVPTTYGDTPGLGAQCSWGGRTLTVRDVEPLAIDGTTILANVVVGE